MLEQIAAAKADASMIEDKLLKVFEQMDKLKADTEQEKQALKEEENKFNEFKKKIEDRVKVIDDRLGVLEAQRNQVAPEIDPKVFGQYERILKNREGLAIVLVKNSTCQGCNMSMPPQVMNLIKMYEAIVTCEICNRMLYIDE
ncbi:MAG: C4-type zinc ribbon domain-containing protein [Candidatus Omnitrophota bacterium]